MKRATWFRTFCITLCIVIQALAIGPAVGQPTAPGGQLWPAEAFRLMWQRTDQLVASGDVNYSWYWGPQSRSQPLLERNEESPGSKRLVVYYDKGRMELEPQLAAGQSTTHLSFGRLVAEMVSGSIQLGTRRVAPGPAARIPVAGDLDDPLPPTYATFAAFTGPTPAAVGQSPRYSLDRTGSVQERPDLAANFPKTVYHRFDDVTGHNVPQIFDSFLRQQGLVTTPDGTRTEQLIDPVAIMGRPLTEAYWASVAKDGAVRPVLVQLYERRVLTYTPSNPARFQVEMGNAGLHYYQWRYSGAQPRTTHVERLLDHFERSDSQALDGNYWFSFDDRTDGGSSTASNGLITPGVFDSIHAMRFTYERTAAIPFSFTSLSLNLGAEQAPADLRGTSAVGFWARNNGNTRFQLQMSSALADAPFQTLFAIPNGDWNWIEVPISAMQQDADKRSIALNDALGSATRLSIRPASPGSGTLDIDNIVFIRGDTVAPPPQPGFPQIDDFEDGDLVTVVGTTWFTYDDRADAGGSVPELAVIQPGAKGSDSALRFRGTLDPQWTDVPYLGMGVPLAMNGATVDISEYSGVELTVRTDGQKYRIQVNSKLIQDGNQYGLTLVAPSEWTTIFIPFKLLQPLDPDQPIGFQLGATQAESIIITPLDKPPAFQIVIDDIHLVK